MHPTTSPPTTSHPATSMHPTSLPTTTSLPTLTLHPTTTDFPTTTPHPTTSSPQTPARHPINTRNNVTACNTTKELKKTFKETLPTLASRCMVNSNWSEWYPESNEKSGWFASPFFPGRYPQGSRCEWVIREDEKSVVSLDFLDFDLGADDGISPYCSDAYDLLLIRDCVSGMEQTLCGNTNNIVELQTLSNYVEIEFHGSHGNGKGFQTYYVLKSSDVEGQMYRTRPRSVTTTRPYRVMPDVTDRSTRHLTTEVLSNTDVISDPATSTFCEDVGSDVCGGLLRLEFGFFSSQFYPEDFPIESNCRWSIRASDPHAVAVKFLDVDLGGPSSTATCDTRYSFIRLNISGDTIFICNTVGLSVFVSPDGQIDIEFSSQYGSGRGFCAAYRTVPTNQNHADLEFPCLCPNLYTNVTWATSEDPVVSLDARTCQFMISEGSGTFPSETFPTPYPPNSECVWTLLAEPGDYVRLKFLELDLDPLRMRRRRCLLSDTHVQITLFEGDEVVHKRFCSDDDPYEPIPPARTVIVKFKSGDIPNHTHKGFRISYNFDNGSFEGFRVNPVVNNTASNSSNDNFGFRVFIDYDDYSSSYSDDEIVVDQGRKTTEDEERPRVTVPVGRGFENSSLDLESLVSDQVTVVTEIVYMTGEIETESLLGDTSADLRSSTSRLSEGSTTTPLSSREPDTTPPPISEGNIETNTLIPGKGNQLTARQMELTIYICTAVAAFLIIVLILVTLYCAKNRRRNNKAGFDVDAADEANYWQTYKDWAKDCSTEPVGSAQSTVGAQYGDNTTTQKGLSSSGDVALNSSPSAHMKTVSALVNQPPVDKPPRQFFPSEKLV